MNAITTAILNALAGMYLKIPFSKAFGTFNFFKDQYLRSSTLNRVPRNQCDQIAENTDYKYGRCCVSLLYSIIQQ